MADRVLGVRVPEEVIRAVKVAAVGCGETVQGWVVGALRLRLGGGDDASRSGTVSGVGSAERGAGGSDGAVHDRDVVRGSGGSRRGAAAVADGVVRRAVDATESGIVGRAGSGSIAVTGEVRCRGCGEKWKDHQGGASGQLAVRTNCRRFVCPDGMVLP